MLQAGVLADDKDIAILEGLGAPVDITHSEAEHLVPFCCSQGFQF